MNPTPRRLVVALGTFAFAALVFGYALFRAMTVEPVSAMPLPAPVTVADADAASPTVPPAPTKKVKPRGDAPVIEVPVKQDNVKLDDLLMAVEADPFRPDRQRVPDRYRMPGEEVVVEEPVVAPPPPPPPPFRVIGTLVSPTGGVAIIQHNETGARMVVGLGENLPGMSGYKVDRVATTNATVSNSVQTVTLPVIAASTGRGGRAGGPAGRGGAAQTPAQQQQLQTQMQNLQRAMEQLRSMGNSPQVQQMMEQLNRQMVETRQQQAAGGRGGAVDFQFESAPVRGGAATVPPPPIRMRVDTVRAGRGGRGG